MRELTPLESKLYSLADCEDGVTCHQLVNAYRISKSSIQKATNSLVAMGLLEILYREETRLSWEDRPVKRTVRVYRAKQ